MIETGFFLLGLFLGGLAVWSHQAEKVRIAREDAIWWRTKALEEQAKRLGVFPDK